MTSLICFILYSTKTESILGKSLMKNLENKKNCDRKITIKIYYKHL